MKTHPSRWITVSAVLVTLLAVAVGLLAWNTRAGALGQRQLAGVVIPARHQSPHPAPTAWDRTYTYPGAKFVRLHFTEFDLAPGDVLVISSPDGSQSWEYSGQGPHGNGEFWSFAIDGDTVDVTLSAPSGKSFGFKVKDVGYGTVDLGREVPQPEIVIVDDGREPVACHTDETVVAEAQSPVARLLFTDKNKQYLCTGELVSGNQDNMLITNAHCIDSQEIVSSLEARFNYQYTDCAGTVMADPEYIDGATFLKTNSERYSTRGRNKGGGLDYTLLTLQGNPESTYGELTPTALDASVGNALNFIQHPAGRPKEIGYYEDSDHAARCDVHTILQTYGSAAPGTQMGYVCDSEGGSSGSAITRASDGLMFGLHHYGGVDSGNLNAATMMRFICEDAGSLLNCVGD